MVKILDGQGSDKILDFIARYGMVMAASLLNGLNNIITIYNDPKELYWLRVQQLLTFRRETETILCQRY